MSWCVYTIDTYKEVYKHRINIYKKKHNNKAHPLQ